MSRLFSRRQLLKGGAVAASALLVGCQPKVVEVTRVVTEEKIVKETVQVEVEKQVEKEVTRVVEKEVQVDAAAAKAAEMKGKLVWDTFRANAPWDKDRLDNFKNLYPNVEVELRMGVADQQANYAKWYAMQAAGDLGDVVQFDPSHFHFWRAADKNIIMPIDDLVAAANTNLDEWYPNYMAMQNYKGSIWGLPSWGWSGPDAIVVNEIVMQEIGVELPDPQSFQTSWEQILEWMEKSHKASGDKVERYGYQFGGGEAGYTIQTRWFGGDLINAEGTKCIFQDDEKALKGLRTTYDVVVNKKLAPVPGALGQGVSVEVACAEGRLAMWQGGSLSARNCHLAVKDPKVAKISCILFPKRPDGKIPSQIRGGAWQIAKSSKIPQIAYEFAYHLTSKDGCLGFNLFGGNTAFVRPDVLPLLFVQAPIFKHWEANLSGGMVINAPANSRGREFTDAIAQNGAKLMDAIKPIPFEQGVAEMAAEIQKILDMPPA